MFQLTLGVWGNDKRGDQVSIHRAVGIEITLFNVYFVRLTDGPNSSD